MKPRRNASGGAARRRAGHRPKIAPGWSLPADDMLLYEKFAFGAMIGVLAAQTKEPSAKWVRRVSFRIGCDMAEEAVRLRRKQQ
jgi:hypothetical protein